jgi:hypothetical protein
MKFLLLALLVSSPLMTPATSDPKTTSDGPFQPWAYGQVSADGGSALGPTASASCPPDGEPCICGPGEVWRAYYYRQSQSLTSPECGYKYFTCEGTTYQQGCLTAYHTQAIFCMCP